MYTAKVRCPARKNSCHPISLFSPLIQSLHPQAKLVRCPACLTVNAVWAEAHQSVTAPDPLPLTAQCLQWSESQVGVFVHSIKCDQATLNALAAYHVDGPQLLDLTRSDLLQMGLKSEEQIQALLGAVEVVRGTGFYDAAQ